MVTFKKPGWYSRLANAALCTEVKKPCLAGKNFWFTFLELPVVFAGKRHMAMPYNNTFTFTVKHFFDKASVFTAHHNKNGLKKHHLSLSLFASNHTPHHLRQHLTPAIFTKK